jgi:hypothetical protein
LKRIQGAGFAADTNRNHASFDEQRRAIAHLSNAAVSGGERRHLPRRPGADRAPGALAGYRQAITRDAAGGVERHFVILPFAARWIAGEVALNEELAEAQWREPSALSDLKTTEGLELIVNAAWERITAR